MSGNVTITAKEYLELRKDAAKLQLLEEGGVDNWEWYGESLHEGERNITALYKEIETEVQTKINP